MRGIPSMTLGTYLEYQIGVLDRSCSNWSQSRVEVTMDGILGLTLDQGSNNDKVAPG